ncbi:MAG TPA: hypothetical protein VLE89_06760 [Chlamydiales bacterium]|nr:hypothetical protein [Chlamydiales bacterium]
MECPDLANARFLIELPEINNQLEDLERMDKEIRALDDQNRRLLIPTKGIDAFANKVSSLQTEVSMEDLNEAGKYLEFANQFLSGCDRVLKLCGEEKAVFLTTRSTLQFLKSTGRGKETRMRACLVGMEDSIGGLERREMHDYHIKEAAKCIKSVRDKLAELSQNHQALLATCAVIGAMRKSAQQNKPS